MVKKKAKRGRKSMQSQSLYKFNSFVTETPGNQIFAISFNYFIKDRQIFASAAGNKITIYECLDSDELGHPIKLLRVYSEPDKDEVFNSVAWSFDSGGPILATGGVKSVVRIIQCNGKPMSAYKNLIGHSELIFNNISHCDVQLRIFYFQPVQ